jgi:hypothetical protein
MFKNSSFPFLVHFHFHFLLFYKYSFFSLSKKYILLQQLINMIIIDNTKYACHSKYLCIQFLIVLMY